MIGGEVDIFFNGKLTQKMAKIANYDKVLIGYKFKEFNQDVIKIITNDGGFITSFCGKCLEPPSPQNVFPDRGFGTYGSLQGDMEYWWDVYWHPFWSRLTEYEKEKYILQNDFS
ncbi:MAG: hypothetical protein XXXJIFNMEKO3_02651 [Candidatus Erwinia impunctatus]